MRRYRSMFSLFRWYRVLIRDFFPEWWDDRSVVVLLVLFFIGLFLFGLDILDE